MSEYSLRISVVDRHRLDASLVPDPDLQHCFAAHTTAAKFGPVLLVAFKILGHLKERTSRSRRLNREKKTMS
jgi:hypothetical protein